MAALYVFTLASLSGSTRAVICATKISACGAFSRILSSSAESRAGAVAKFPPNMSLVPICSRIVCGLDVASQPATFSSMPLIDQPM
jgi:hypothetical protein